jgi:teichuronic acid biosynthesis glycosyltransferase TuaC
MPVIERKAASRMKILLLTNMYPVPDRPHFGIFVQEQVESLRRNDVEVDVLFVDGAKNRLNYLLGFPRLWLRLMRQDYDLIHAHYIFAGLIARAQSKVPVVMTHHGPEVFMTWQSVLCRMFTRYFERVIVVSEEMKDRLRSREAYVIPCGVDLHLFQPESKSEKRAELGIDPHARVVLWAGDPRPEKRYELVSAAMEKLKTRRKDVELVTLSGKPHSIVPKYMNAADVLVLTSDAEGSPMVVKEAMACNVPVVSTNVGDVAVLTSGTQGCFITSRDPADIARKLDAALDVGRTNGREAVAQLSVDAIGRRVIEVYQTLSRDQSPVALEATRQGTGT